jgi:hypothetical protein
LPPFSFAAASFRAFCSAFCFSLRAGAGRMTIDGGAVRRGPRGRAQCAWRRERRAQCARRTLLVRRSRRTRVARGARVACDALEGLVLLAQLLLLALGLLQRLDLAAICAKSERSGWRREDGQGRTLPPPPSRARARA